LATGGEDNRVIIWDLKTGLELRTFSGDSAHRDGNAGWIDSLAFDPKGRWLAAGSRNNSLRIWEVGTWRELATITNEGAVLALAFSRDGKLLASCGRPNRITVRQAGTWTESVTLTTEAWDFKDMAFSPDGQLTSPLVVARP